MDGWIDEVWMDGWTDGRVDIPTSDGWIVGWIQGPWTYNLCTSIPDHFSFSLQNQTSCCHDFSPAQPSLDRNESGSAASVLGTGVLPVSRLLSLAAKNNMAERTDPEN